MTKVVHDEDIGSGLDIVAGKLVTAATQATDAEVATAIQASEATDATEEQGLLNTVRLQEGLFNNTVWEMIGNKVRANTVVGTENRFLSISSLGSIVAIEFHFPAAGDSVPSVQGVAPIVVDSNGFLELPNWGVLWYKYAGTNKGWYWSVYSLNALELSSEYIRVLALNSYDRTAQLSDGSFITQGLNYQDTNWMDLTPYLTAGIVNYGNGFRTLRFRRKNNRVYLEGLVLVPAPNYVGGIANLPYGFTPQTQHIFSGRVDTGVARVDVAVSGAVSAITNPSAAQWLSLDGINFGLD